MGAQPTLIGDIILQKTFRAGEGLLPFRAVCLDSSVTLTPAGDDWLPPVIYPNTTFADLETIVGVIVGPASESTLGTLDTIAADKAVDVRVAGVVPLMMDTTVGATPVRIGEYVKSSETSGQDGAGCRAPRTNNVIDADAHVIGVAWTSVSTNNRYGLVKIHPLDF